MWGCKGCKPIGAETFFARLSEAFGTRSWSSLASLRSTLSSKSSRSSESESSESRLSSPRCKRSCLVRSIRESLDEEVMTVYV